MTPPFPKKRKVEKGAKHRVLEAPEWLDVHPRRNFLDVRQLEGVDDSCQGFSVHQELGPRAREGGRGEWGRGVRVGG